MLLGYMLYWKDISKLTVKAIRFATKSCQFKRPFENLGVGISASASSLELALQKFSFCLQKFL